MRNEVNDFKFDLNLFNDISNITKFGEDDSKIYYEEKSFINTIKDNLTEEQRKRDSQITDLLKHFVNNYEHKTKDNRTFKIILFAFCIIFVSLFSIALCVTIINISKSKYLTGSDVVAIISACTTLIAVPISVLKIIVSYIFPNQEEKYINEIVQLIQNNDLENKKTNISASFDEKEKTDKEQ